MTKMEFSKLEFYRWQWRELLGPTLPTERTKHDLYSNVFSALQGAVDNTEFTGDDCAWDVFQKLERGGLLLPERHVPLSASALRVRDTSEILISPFLIWSGVPMGVGHSHIKETMSLFACQIEEAYSALEGGDDAEFQSVVRRHLNEFWSLAKAQREELRFILQVQDESGELLGLSNLAVLFLESFQRIEVEASSELELACNAIVLAVALLSVIYLYLIGYVNSKAFSSHSVHFRGDIYICIVLFLGSYIWIKFRQAAPNPATIGNRKRKSWAEEGEQHSDREGVHRIPIPDGTSGRSTGYIYEPVFTPPRGLDACNRVIKPSKLSLGKYDTFEEALVVHRLAKYFYHGKESPLVLDDGSLFSILPMSEDERSSLSVGGENSHPLMKRKCIQQKVKEVYVVFQEENARLKQQSSATMTDADFGHGRDAGSDPAPSAVDVATCSVQGISNPADERTSCSDSELNALCATFPGGHASESMLARDDNSLTSLFSDVNSEMSEQVSFITLPAWKMEDVRPASDDVGNAPGPSSLINSQILHSLVLQNIAAREQVFVPNPSSQQRVENHVSVGVPEVDGHVSNSPDQSGFIANAATSEHVLQPQVNPNPVSGQLQGNSAAAIVVFAGNVTDGLQRQAESPKETRDTSKDELFRKLMDIWNEGQEAAHKKQIAELRQEHQDEKLKLHQEYQDRILKLEQEKRSMQGVILQAFKVLSPHAGN